MSEPPDNPGVRVPPPALYVLAVLGGYVIHRRWPLPVGDSVWLQALAWALIVMWLVLTVSSIGNFRCWRTSIIPVRPATALVISGPYRFTRNPMYVALVALTVALSLFLDTWWAMVLLLPVLLVVRVFVIAPEERYLQRRFWCRLRGVHATGAAVALRNDIRPVASALGADSSIRDENARSRVTLPAPNCRS